MHGLRRYAKTEDDPLDDTVGELYETSVTEDETADETVYGNFR